MRLRSLTLRDFGTIRGEQVLDLAPREKYGKMRTVVLIGGQNGAGKTTLLEAVRLCLYGRLALGNRVSDVDYKKYLRERIHRDRNALIHVDSAAIRLSFDYARAGRRTVYTVERSWQAQGKTSVIEAITLLRDGNPLTDVESQHWESFVRSLVPFGLSQLFFFDGERIQKLAEDGIDSEALAESVKSMLGLDLVEQLQTDLTLFETRFLSRSATKKEHRIRVQELEAERERLETESTRLAQEAANRKSLIDGLDGELGRARERLELQGKSLADERSRLTQGVGEFQARIEENERALREVFEGAAPLVLCATLVKRTIAQLDSETLRSRAHFAKHELETALATVRDHLTKPAFVKRLRLDADGRRAVSEELARVQQEVLQPLQSAEANKIVHGLSEHDSSRFREQARDAAQSAERARKATRELSRLENRLRTVKLHLGQAPEKDDLAPLVAKLEQLGEQRGAAVSKLEQFQAERQVVTNGLERARRELEKLVQEEDKDKAGSKKLSLASQAKASLAVYLERLTEQKMNELQRLATESFARLCRKTDFVRTMRIDPATFRVTLLDKHDRVLQKEELSAGEKQIYAISVLWALSKVAGRPLPMIIDTPLGRLDSQHRQRLVEDYFPQASHQVIILSTDTEIDQTYLKALQPHLSHTIHLVYHEEEGWTKATPGYFWTGDGANAAAV